MAKRSGANSHGGRGSKSRKKVASPTDVDHYDHSSDMGVKLEAHTWFEDLLEGMKSLLNDHGSPSAALDFLVPNKLEWKDYLELHVPPDASLGYTKEWSKYPGVCLLQLWQASWHPDAGLAGHVVHDKFIELCKCILGRGLLTDPIEGAGIEIPVIQPFDTDKMTPVEGYEIGVHGVAFIKGWRRCMAASFCIATLRHLDLMDSYKEVATENVLKSFGCVGGNYLKVDGHRAIVLSRGGQTVGTHSFLVLFFEESLINEINIKG